MDALDSEKGKEASKAQPIFRDLNADDPDPEVSEIESLCLQCRKNGTTKVLITKIPFYKEVIVMSFNCEHCHWENNELLPASKIQEKGIFFKLRVKDIKDLSRQLVKTEWASVLIPELEFEIPPHTQEGTVTTIEGILERAYEGIKTKQEELEREHPEDAKELEEFLKKFAKLKEGSTSFDFILRDSSGNSFLENIWAPMNDPVMEITHFCRSREENLLLGIQDSDAEVEKHNGTLDSTVESQTEQMKNEVLEFPTNCSFCNAPCITNMKLTNVPHFKDVVIMATSCDACGNKTNEVKSGSGIEPLGVKISLQITEEKDLTRDLLKSDTCEISIPELELVVGSAALTGRYTTVEGILSSIKDQLKENNPVGDSSQPEMKERMTNFLEKLDEIMKGNRKVTLILDDPCGNSYLQSIHYPEPDTNMTVERYTRTSEQDEELGLLDMKVENYEET